MRAAVYRKHGSARDVLRVEDVVPPEPGPEEVRVRVRVSAVNPTDCKSRSGTNGRPVEEFQIPHHDGAGVIDAVGSAVPGERIGQRVWIWFAAAERPWGTAAEWTVVPACQAVPLPQATSFDLGACFGVPAITAHRCLFTDGPVTGKTVLVAGGAGAVGHFAVQLAKEAGARVVATVSNDRKAAHVSAAGADLVVNYREPGAGSSIARAVTHVDRVVEVAPAANLDLNLSLAGPETVISVYAADDADASLPVLPSMLANVTVRFVWLYGVPKPVLVAAAEHVAASCAAGALTELPVRRFPLEDIAAAHEAAESGTAGKVLIDVD